MSVLRCQGVDTETWTLSAQGNRSLPLLSGTAFRSTWSQPCVRV